MWERKLYGKETNYDKVITDIGLCSQNPQDTLCTHLMLWSAKSRIQNGIVRGITITDNFFSTLKFIHDVQ